MGRRPIQIVLLASAGLAIAARAQVQPPPQDGGPVLVGPRHESWSGFELERIEAYLDFLGQHTSDKQSPAGLPSVKDRENLLRESLGLTGQASIGHKNLLDLTGTIQLGLEDRYTDSQTADLNTHDSEFVQTYDVRALFLGNSAMPTTVYSRREQNLLDRAFAGNIEMTSQETGVISQIQSERAPTTLHYFHRQIDLTDDLGQSDSTTIQDTFTLQSGIRITEGQRLDVAYTFDHFDENQEGFFSDTFDRHDANIVHTLDFGGVGRPNELRSSLRVFDQGGQFSQEDLRLDELLILKHSERLETRYNLSVDDQSQGDTEQRLYHGEALVIHRLFDSLVSRASVGGQRLEAEEDFTSTGAFTTGSLDYTKKVPLGTLEASVGAAYNSEHNSARGGTLGIQNEPHVFNDPFPIVLSRRNIVADSIVVTPPSGFPPYRPGLDYTVRVFPDRAEISVPPGSPIVDGQSVLCSYDVGPEPENDIDTTAFSLSFRYTLAEGSLQGLSFYTTYRTLDQNLDTADPSLFVLDNTQHLLLGVEYMRSGLDVKVEREEHDSTVDPYNTNRIQAFYQHELGRDSWLNFEATHETTDYTVRDEEVDFDRLMGKWNQRLGPAFTFNARLEYRNEQDSLSGDTEAFDQILGFSWHKAQTTIYGSVKNGFVNGPGAETTSQLLQIGVRRAF